MQILHNAKIYNPNHQGKLATALVIDDHAPLDGRILAVGTDAEIKDGFGHRTVLRDMQGAVILPGLTDAHLHLQYYAHSLTKADLFNLSKAETLSKIAQRAQETPVGKWVLGHGFNQNDWPEGFPTAADLDRAAPNHPVLLTSASLHSAWCNSAALKAAGVNANTPDPKNGRFGRNGKGEPDGMLFETAESLISSVIPKPSHHENMAAIKTAQKKFWEMGLTGVHDFDRIPSFKALQDLHKNGDLKLRTIKMLPVDHLDDFIETGLRTGFGDNVLRIGGIKIFADGALGPHTAAMLRGYEDDTENLGMLFVDHEEFFEQAQKATQAGLSMAVHAIGDKANHEILKGYAQLRNYEQENDLPHLRHRIEHVQLLDSQDIGKLAELGIVASMQPIHATADLEMADKYWGNRTKNSYAWNSLLNMNTPLVFGSDAPVDSPNPFWGIHAAVTRQRPDGSPDPEGWIPKERVNIDQAIAGYTTGPAYAAGMEDRLGQISPGYLADLIVLDVDPLSCDPMEIRGIQPKATMLGGDWVWESPN